MSRRAISFTILCMITSMGKAQVPVGDPDLPQKLSLAQEYHALTHKREISEDTARRQLKLAWDGCDTDPCRKKLDQVIADSIAKAYPSTENAEVTLLASRLTTRELEAAVTFARSPEGQSILAKESAMTGDFAQIGHAFAKAINDDLLKDFCATEHDACARIAARQYAVMQSKK